jgi:hypothetical protein
MPAAPKQQKTVHFEEGTNFEPCRPRHKYRRTSRKYASGKYSCPNREGWQDTSFQHDYMYQLDHHKVLRAYDTEGKDNVQIERHVNVLRTEVRTRMQEQCYHGVLTDRQTVAEHEAGDDLKSMLQTTLDRPPSEASRTVIKSICTADGLTLMRKRTGEYVTVDWVTDTRTNDEAAAFIFDLRAEIPPGNRGERRSVILKRLRDGEIVCNCDSTLKT